MNTNQSNQFQFLHEVLTSQQLLKIKGGVEDKRASRPGTKGNTKTTTGSNNSKPTKP